MAILNTNAVFLRAALYLISLQHKVQTNVNLLSSTFYDLLSLYFDQYSLCLILSQQSQIFVVFSIKNYLQFQIQSACFDFNAPWTCTKLAFFSLLATDMIF